MRIRLLPQSLYLLGTEIGELFKPEVLARFASSIALKRRWIVQ